MRKKERIDINTEYQQQLAFEYSEDQEELKALLSELKVSIEYKGCHTHFEGDTEEREVISVKIERNNQEINFDYGLSLVDTAQIELLNAYGVNDLSLLTSEKLKQRKMFGFNGRYQEHTAALNTFFNTRYIGKLLSGSGYSLEMKHAKQLLKPLDLLYGVLCSVRSDYYCSKRFNDFCDDYGYDNDSIKAKKIWESCLEQSGELETIFRQSEVDCLPY